MVSSQCYFPDPLGFSGWESIRRSWFRAWLFLDGKWLDASFWRMSQKESSKWHQFTMSVPFQHFCDVSKAGKITFPKIFHKEAKSLVKKLLTPDLGLDLRCHRKLSPVQLSGAPGKRFGNLKNGAADIKEHKWFKDRCSVTSFFLFGSPSGAREDLSWEDLTSKKIEAPFKSGDSVWWPSNQAVRPVDCHRMHFSLNESM